jgi:uncharacterized membrane protein YdjX (TVP38/TMEM64 family)
VLLGLLMATVATRLPRARNGVVQLVGRIDATSTHHWLAFCGGQVLIAASGILPASLMAVAAGAAYGMAKGLMTSAICTLLGGWLAFLLSRSMLRPWIARLIGRFGASARFDDAIASEGWRFVCLLRISPVMPFAVTSYGLGLTRISQRAYLLGTLASLPALASYVALGAFGREGVALGRAQAGPLQWILPLLGVIAVFVAVARVKRLIDKAGGPRRAGISEPLREPESIL